VATLRVEKVGFLQEFFDGSLKFCGRLQIAVVRKTGSEGRGDEKP